MAVGCARRLRSGGVNRLPSLNRRSLSIFSQIALTIPCILIFAMPAFARKSDSDFYSRNKAWIDSVPVDQVSASGMPTGQLVACLWHKDYRGYQRLLRATPFKPAQKAERQMWSAVQFAVDQRFEEAAELFDKVPRLADAPVLVRVKAANSYAMVNKFDRAIALSSGIVAKYPMLEAYNIRAGSYAATNKLVAAAGDFEKLADIDVDNKAPHVYGKAASLLLKAGKVDRALAVLDKAQKRKGADTSVTVYMVRTDCYKALGRWKDAVKSLDRAIAICKNGDPRRKEERDMNLYTCYKERAKCYRKLGRNDLADADMKTLNDRSEGVVDAMIGTH